jgi:hypothetical protein
MRYRKRSILGDHELALACRARVVMACRDLRLRPLVRQTSTILLAERRWQGD